ncbi:hypothetical protein B7463_g2493, partial [Scytalidium lignicola]
MIDKIGFSDSPTIESTSVGKDREVSNDEYQLAGLGYKQEFTRVLGLFENWASVFTAMNFVSGIAGLLGWALYTGGPTPAFTYWVLVGAMAVNLSLVMAEIAAAYPTAGGIYFWSYRLGGPKFGPFLAWMTAWWNFSGWLCSIPSVQQNSTNFLLSAIEIKYPNLELLHYGWFEWILTFVGTLLALIPNVISHKVMTWYLRFAVVSALTLFFCYVIWLPAKASGHFRPSSQVFNHFDNGINFGTEKQASDAYVWTIAVLFSAWVFYGFGELQTPLQTGGKRVVFAISRDGVLPFSKYFRKLNRNGIPTNAALLVGFLSIAISTAVIGSTVAFTAITATGTIAANFSYIIPIISRYTIGRKRFTPAAWNLGHASQMMGLVAVLYILFLFTVLLLPQEYPVTAQTLNYAPICIGIVTVVSLVGWILPFGLGAWSWFHGPKKTIDVEEFNTLTIVDKN